MTDRLLCASCRSDRVIHRTYKPDDSDPVHEVHCNPCGATVTRDDKPWWPA